jgi:hypothetical protein
VIASNTLKYKRGDHRDRIVVGFITTNVPVQSLPKIPKVVSSNPAHDGEVHMIQHYVIKFVSDLRQVDGILLSILVSSTNKTDSHDITEILLKVVLNTTTPNPIGI